MSHCPRKLASIEMGDKMNHFISKAWPNNKISYVAECTVMLFSTSGRGSHGTANVRHHSLASKVHYTNKTSATAAKSRADLGGEMLHMSPLSIPRFGKRRCREVANP